MFGLSQVTVPTDHPDVPIADSLTGRTGRTGTHAATRAVLAAWTLIGLGISAHDGEYSAWGLAALVVAFVLVAAVAVARQALRTPDRLELAVPLAVCFVAAVVHPAYRLMH